MKAFPPKRILVPMDMSKPSLTALEAAKTLARATGARLELVYVQDLPVSLLGFGAEAGTGRELSRQMDEFRHWREERLARATADMPRSRVKVRTVHGWAPSALVELARAPGVDLIVMGTHGYAGMNRVFFGSVAEAVVRAAATPVLTVHARGKASRFSRILVPFNGKPYARAALSCAAALARRRRAKLSVLYVEPAGIRETDLLPKLEAAAAAAAPGARFLARAGDVPHEVIKEALSGGHDLIVLSAHRRRFWSDFVLGTTAERVLRHSPVPVLSIPSKGSIRAPR